MLPGNVSNPFLGCEIKGYFRNYAQGDQVCVSYGQLNNFHLLSKYGFIVQDNNLFPHTQATFPVSIIQNILHSRQNALRRPSQPASQPAPWD
jgi:hypothetical protein